MRIPAWLDIALEGGAHELERALVRYRSLRRHLELGDWRAGAGHVAELSAAIGRQELDVAFALDKALRRARRDPTAGAATHLAIAIERERHRLAAALEVRAGAHGSLPDMLAWLEDTARDESLMLRPWLHYRIERGCWTVLLGAVFAAIPLCSWISASDWGGVPTVATLEGLADPSIVLVMIAAAALLVGARLRLASWGWLGVGEAAPRPGPAAALYVGAATCGSVAAVAGALPFVALAVALLLGLTLHLLRGMWFYPHTPLVAPLR